MSLRFCWFLFGWVFLVLFSKGQCGCGVFYLWSRIRGIAVNRSVLLLAPLTISLAFFMWIQKAQTFMCLFVQSCSRQASLWLCSRREEKMCRISDAYLLENILILYEMGYKKSRVRDCHYSKSPWTGRKCRLFAFPFFFSHPPVSSFEVKCC